MVKEVDTGATTVSVCKQDFYEKMFKSLKLFPTDLSLNSFTNQPIVPIGILRMFVSSLQKCIWITNMDHYVIENGLQPLMGRDWLGALGVEIPF